ncbi:winged helix-turn-helix transcriptional regulator [Pseudooceanicola sp. CBS1P-1]|uniref:Winged helix-turn-helix transcriptional regulator n=1 Tax=Pseudooceanicola albus TaxID=2692189 RepID=A0A6L7FWX5_9RHOB|nr:MULTISPECIES: carbohydrate kinase [Pseudooceanicola]MBT9383964.1 winged helix-turn-helix transcriptional regulator [Pseudooceanicola endophyticus]MXN16624.1 winged helix-turn-helix transcriptional regulator [Pseudooceanicola albus]
MDELSPLEAAILRHITHNPFAGQQETADQLGIARSTVAAHIVSLTRKGYILGRGYVLPAAKRVVCVGGGVLDRKYRAKQGLQRGTSNPVEGFHSFGGVARNVVENLALLGHSTSFLSVVGEDETGRHLLGHLRDRGVDVSQVGTSNRRSTAEYCAILSPEGELELGIADMEIFEELGPERLDRAWSHIASASMVFSDCNPPLETILALIERRKASRFRLAIDPVSTHKARKLPQDLSGIDLLFMNVDEANGYLGTALPNTREGALAACDALRARGAGGCVISVGVRGMAVSEDETRAFIPAVPSHPVEVTGAGDGMIAGTLHALMGGAPLAEAARTGSLLAALTVETATTVRADLSAQLLETSQHRLSPAELHPAAE